ncbi:MAG: ATP-binding protein, partial [Acidobacteriota bacterium]
GRKSPLFGRRTAQILLRPFGYREAALFHPGYSTADQAQTYFLCGGVPYYLRAFSDRRSVSQNVVAELLDEYAALHREPDFLLREELRDVESYYAVLLALAAGAGTAAEIAKISDIAPASLPYYLKQLAELGYIERRYPLTGGRQNPRSVRYRIQDPLLRFWFRFVFPNQSQIRQLGPEKAHDQLIAPRLDAYYGSCFERLCREAIPEIYRRDGVTANFEVGEFWGAQAQIDVVSLRKDGWTDLGECKWGRIESRSAVETELERKMTAFPNSRGATFGLHVFSRRRRPARAPASRIRWHSLDDLYAD